MTRALLLLLLLAAAPPAIAQEAEDQPVCTSQGGTTQLELQTAAFRLLSGASMRTWRRQAYPSYLPYVHYPSSSHCRDGEGGSDREREKTSEEGASEEGARKRERARTVERVRESEREHARAHDTHPPKN